MKPRRSRLLTLLAALTIVAAACGTRLPDSAFEQQTEGGGDAELGPAEGGESNQVAEGNRSDRDSGGSSTKSGGKVSGSGSGGSGASGGGDGGSAGPAAGGGQPGAGPAAPGAGPGGAGAAGPNQASDVGVTATSIKIGNITAVKGPLGPDAFTPVYHGLKAYVDWLNERGGVNGRKIDLNTCDDQEDAARNKSCAQSLVEDQKVFALVGNSTHTYSAAKYVDSKGVPDVGGEPIGNAYYKYRHLYSVLGAAGYPRDGANIGKDGKVYAQTATYRWFKKQKGVSKAAVFFYFIPISKTAGDFIADGLEREGIDVAFTPNGGAGRNPADPSYDSDVLSMQRAGVDAVWNAIDIAGFQKLCQAMDRYQFTVKANVSTIQGWSQQVGERFSSPCRKSVFVGGASVPYSETSNPSVAEFRSAMNKYDSDFPMHQWALEGWAAGMLFTDAVKSMGAAPTRKGLLAWLDAQRDYTVHGLMQGIDWRRSGVDFGKPAPECFSLAQWNDGKSTFVPATKTFTCDTTAYYSYVPEADGS